MIGSSARQARDSARESAHRAEAAAARAGAEVTRVSGGAGSLVRHSPFYLGFFGALGALLAIFLGQQVLMVRSTIVLIVVSAFLAVGLNPLVEFFIRRGLKRAWAVLVVIVLVVGVLALFVTAIVPVMSDQVSKIVDQAPGWFDSALHNRQVQRLDDRYDVISKAKEYVTKGDYASAAAGGALGFGIAVLSALVNTFVIIVLTIYFLSSLPKTKQRALPPGPGQPSGPGPRASGTRSSATWAPTSPARSWSRWRPASRRWSSCSSSASVSTPSRWPSWWRCSTSSR